jgi:tetratricopeptide (TPR) repeat protein
VLTFTFVFTGLFIAASRLTGIISSRVLGSRESVPTRLILSSLIVILALSTLWLGSIVYNKTVAAYYFKKAVDHSNVENPPLQEMEDTLIQALQYDPVDLHYIALSRINFAQAQRAASNTTGTPEENRAVFEESLRESIEAARSAVSDNPASYQNWVALGIIYSSLVAEPLKVEGAYDNARFAYNEAKKRNPTNPELSLLFAQLELSNSNPEAARSFIREAIVLKEDYADAYLMLAQMEIQAGNTAEAIASAEQLVFLMPNNAGLYFELGLLKYSSGDYTGAAEAFILALGVVPDYANAQYYLGLSFAQLGQLDDALEQFEALAITNPNSPEVQTALEALRAGNSPL